MRGRVRTVAIDGAEWTPPHLGIPVPAPGGGGGAGAAPLPFDRVEIRDGAVTFAAGGSTLRAPIAGTIERLAAGGLRFSLSAGLEGTERVSFRWQDVCGSIGSVRLAGALPLDAAEKPMVSVRIWDGELSSPERGLAGSGIEAAITADGLRPLSTPAGQRLAVRSGRAGQVPFHDADVTFLLDPAGALRIESAHATVGDGTRLSAAPFAIDLRDPAFTTTIAVESASLAYWLPLLTDGRAMAAGTLSGRVPVSWRPGTARPFSLGEGSLASAPGGGWIAVADARRLGSLLEASDPRFATDVNMRIVRDRLVEALADFEYDELRLDLDPEPDGLLLRVRTSGRGRIGDPAQEIGGLTINVHDFDTALAEVLALNRAGGAGRAREGSHE
jgi:hypothetical protein